MWTEKTEGFRVGSFYFDLQDKYINIMTDTITDNENNFVFCIITRICSRIKPIASSPDDRYFKI